MRSIVVFALLLSAQTRYWTVSNATFRQQLLQPPLLQVLWHKLVLTLCACCLYCLQQYTVSATIRAFTLYCLLACTFQLRGDFSYCCHNFLPATSQLLSTVTLTMLTKTSAVLRGYSQRYAPLD